MASLNIDVDDFTYTPSHNWTTDSPYPKRSFIDAWCLLLTTNSNSNRNGCFALSIGCLGY